MKIVNPSWVWYEATKLHTLKEGENVVPTTRHYKMALFCMLLILLPSACLCQGRSGGLSVINLKDFSEIEGIPQGASTLAFVIDITGSMSDEIGQVKDGANKILDTVLGWKENPVYNYVLVTFQDPAIAVIETTDPENFRTHVQALKVDAGGDCPENSLAAIKTALETALPNSFFYVFTDASANDYHLLPEVVALAQRKESQVVFVMTGDCDDRSGTGYKVYGQIASASSGQVFQLKKAEVNKVLTFVRASLQASKVNLLSVDNKNPGSDTVEVKVDPNLKELTVSLSGDNPKIRLEDPKGGIDELSTHKSERLTLDNVRIVTVKDPITGTWKVHTDSSSAHTIRTTGISSFDIVHGFSRSPTSNFIETSRRPLKGEPNFLILSGTEFHDGSNLDKVQLRGLDGRLLREIPLHKVDGHEDIFNTIAFVPPDDYFYIQVVGKDKDGNPFQRTSSTAISNQLPAVPEVNVKSVLDGFINQPATLRCYVQSLVPVKVAWYRGEDGSIPITPEYTYEQSNEATYTIDRISHAERGRYWCKASNVAGSSSKILYLEVKAPPLTITKAENVSAAEGTVAELSCHVQSASFYDVAWSRLLSENWKHRFSILPMEGNPRAENWENGTLLLHDVSKEDEGWYRCVAANNEGATYRLIYLKIKESCNTAELNVHCVKVGEHCSKNVEVNHMQTVEVSCNTGYTLATKFDKPLQCVNGEWSNMPRCVQYCDAPTDLAENVQLIDLYKTMYLLGERAFLNCTIGYFVINGLLSAVQPITCKGNNTWVPNNQQCLPQDHIRYTYNPQPVVKVDAKVGENLTLLCKQDRHIATSEKDKVTFQWLKNAVDLKTISNIKFTITGEGSLVLLNFSAEYAGMYVCLRMKGFEHIERANVIYNVRTKTPCIPSATNVTTIAQLNTSVTMLCPDAGAGFVDSPVWFNSKGKRIFNDEKHDLISNFGVLLKSVQQSDQGSYICDLGPNTKFCERRFTVNLQPTNETLCGVARNPGKSPWFVTLWRKGEKAPFCYGTLVNDLWVITTAFCLVGVNSKTSPGIFVKLGQQNLENSFDNSVNISVDVAKIHPKYSRRLNTADIGALKLQEPVTFTDDISPICLSGVDFKGDSSPSFAGGVLGLGPLDTELLPTGEECMEVESEDICPPMPDSVFCAKDCESFPKHVADTGSPFQFLYNGRMHLYGIFVWGERKDTVSNYDFFTKVYPYYKWTASVIKSG